MRDRRPRFDLVLFDMDGTLTEVRSPWEHIHRLLGLWDGVGDRHLEAWLAGRIDYDAFFRLDVELWLGRPREELLGILDAIPLKPGVPETLRALDAAGVHPVILSTGFAHVGRRIGEAAGVDLEIHANELVFDAAGRFVSAELVVSGDERSPLAKRAVAPAIMKRLGVRPERALAVGDSAGDTGMFETVGHSLAVCGAPEIGAAGRLASEDLRACLEHILP